MGTAHGGIPVIGRALDPMRQPMARRVVRPADAASAPSTATPITCPAHGSVPTPPALPATTQPAGRQPKLLDRLREALRTRHYSPRTEQTYRHWVKRFIFFHNVRHPAEMAEPEINAFLTHLAVKEKVSASTQNQALSALLFLYRHVWTEKSATSAT